MKIKLLLIIVSIILFAFPCKKKTQNEADLNKKYYKWDQFCMGIDLSYVNQVKDHGGVYKDSGRIKDPFRITKDHGANTVRIRLWHTPKWVSDLKMEKCTTTFKAPKKLFAGLKKTAWR